MVLWFYCRFSNAHPNVVPPQRFVALQSIGGLKELYANIKQTTPTLGTSEFKNNENQTSYTIPGL